MLTSRIDVVDLRHEAASGSAVLGFELALVNGMAQANAEQVGETYCC